MSDSELSDQERRMFYILHKVLHLETLEDRIFDLENKNIELEVNYRILKSQLDKITPTTAAPAPTDDDVTTDHYDDNSQNISPILNENSGSNSNLNFNPIELVCAILGNETESQEEYKDVEEESSMSMGQLDKVNSEAKGQVAEDFNSNSNPVGFIDMSDQLLTEEVKNKPTTNNITGEVDTSIEIEDQNPVLDILPCDKLKLNRNPVDLLKRTDPSLCLRTQKGEKPYSCSVCNRKFSQMSNLSRHKRIHNGEKTYGCTFCPKKFRAKENLVNHIRLHTGERPYSCTICKRKFAQMSNLNRHKRIHNGEKTYGCTFCPKKFRAKENLVSHIRMHTGEKPYSCTICERKFAQMSNLNRHKRVHNRENEKSHGRMLQKIE